MEIEEIYPRSCFEIGCQIRQVLSDCEKKPYLITDA